MERLGLTKMTALSFFAGKPRSYGDGVIVGSLPHKKTKH